MIVFTGSDPTPRVYRHLFIGDKEYSTVYAGCEGKNVQLLPAKEAALKLKFYANELDLTTFIYTGDMIIDWGDGSDPERFYSRSWPGDWNKVPKHTYAATGNYTVSIKGYMVGRRHVIDKAGDLDNDPTRQALNAVSYDGEEGTHPLCEIEPEIPRWQIGSNKILAGMFEGCINLQDVSAGLIAYLRPAGYLTDTIDISRFLADCPQLNYENGAITSAGVGCMGRFQEEQKTLHINASDFYALRDGNPPRKKWIITGGGLTNFSSCPCDIDLSRVYYGRTFNSILSTLSGFLQGYENIVSLNVSGMFEKTTGITAIDPSLFKTLPPNMENFNASRMFAGSELQSGVNLSDLVNRCADYRGGKRTRRWKKFDCSEMLKGCTAYTGKGETGLYCGSISSLVDTNLYTSQELAEVEVNMQGFAQGCSNYCGDKLFGLPIFGNLPNTAKTNVSYFYDGCSKATWQPWSNYPSELTNYAGNMQHAYAFRGCTKMSGYSSIPSGWK